MDHLKSFTLQHNSLRHLLKHSFSGPRHPEQSRSLFKLPDNFNSHQPSCCLNNCTALPPRSWQLNKGAGPGRVHLGDLGWACLASPSRPPAVLSPEQSQALSPPEHSPREVLQIPGRLCKYSAYSSQTLLRLPRQNQHQTDGLLSTRHENNSAWQGPGRVQFQPLARPKCL